MTENWEKILESVLERDGYKCKKCNNHEDLEVHHIKPFALGGSDELGNLETCCWKCHVLGLGKIALTHNRGIAIDQRTGYTKIKRKGVMSIPKEIRGIQGINDSDYVGFIV